jgi:hypothetical protein
MTGSVSQPVAMTPGSQYPLLWAAHGLLWGEDLAAPLFSNVPLNVTVPISACEQG